MVYMCSISPGIHEMNMYLKFLLNGIQSIVSIILTNVGEELIPFCYCWQSQSFLLIVTTQEHYFSDVNTLQVQQLKKTKHFVST